MIGNQIIQEMYPWVYFFIFHVTSHCIFGIYYSRYHQWYGEEIRKNTYYRPYRDPFDRSKRFKCLKTIYSLDG